MSELSNKIVHDIQGTVALYFFLRVNKYNRVEVIDLIGNEDNLKHLDQLIVAGMCKTEEVDGKLYVVDVSERRDYYDIQARYVTAAEILDSIITEVEPLTGEYAKHTLNRKEMCVMHTIAGFECATFDEIHGEFKKKDSMGIMTKAHVSTVIQSLLKYNVITNTDDGYRLTWRL